MQQHDWLVARTKPAQERWAAINVRRQGYEYYLPQFYNRIRKRRVVLFPSYLFVQIPSNDFGVCDFAFLRSTYGVSSIMMMAGGPAIINHKVIDELKSRENEHGVVVLPEQDKADAIDKLRRGDPISIVHGPFSGKNAIFQGMSAKSRINVLLQLLNGSRAIPVSIDRKDIQVAQAA